MGRERKGNYLLTLELTFQQREGDKQGKDRSMTGDRVTAGRKRETVKSEWSRQGRTH